MLVEKKFDVFQNAVLFLFLFFPLCVSGWGEIITVNPPIPPNICVLCEWFTLCVPYLCAVWKTYFAWWVCVLFERLTFGVFVSYPESVCVVLHSYIYSNVDKVSVFAWMTEWNIEEWMNEWIHNNVDKALSIFAWMTEWNMEEWMNEWKWKKGVAGSGRREWREEKKQRDVSTVHDTASVIH